MEESIEMYLTLCRAELIAGPGNEPSPPYYYTLGNTQLYPIFNETKITSILSSQCLKLYVDLLDMFHNDKIQLTLRTVTFPFFLSVKDQLVSRKE